MALDIGTLVAKVKVDDSEFDSKTSQWSQKGAGIASAFGNVAADAIGQAATALADYVGDAASASDATQKFKKSLEFAGLDTSVIDSLTKSTQAYADSTVYNLGDIQNITSNLAAAGVKDFDSLAMALGNLNAIAGGSPETYARLGSVLTQTAGAGKLTTENWNQVTDAIGGSSVKIQDALLQAGAYTGDFRQAMSEGQITAEEFNTALMQLGNDPVAVEAAKSVESFEGAQGNLAAAIQSQLVAALNLIKPAITGFQNGMAWFIQNSGLLVPALAALGAVLLVTLGPAIWAAVVATAAWTVALLANPITWIVLAIGLLVGALVWLIMNWDTAVAWISEVWGGFVNWLVEVCEGIATWWNELWAGFAEWVVSVWEGFIGWITDTWSNFLLGLQIIGNAISSWWNGLWAGVGAWIQSVWEGFIAFVTGVFQGYISWVMSVASGFVNGWNAVWSRVGQIIQTVWNNVVSFFAGIPGAINGLLSGAGQWLYSIGRDIIQGLWNGLKSIWSSVESWFQDTFGGIIDTVAGIFGIHSPSRVFREFGVNIGEGLIQGLDTMTDPIDARFRSALAVPTDTGFSNGSRSASSTSSVVHKENHVHLNEYQALTTEEAIFAALGSPRAKED